MTTGRRPAPSDPAPHDVWPALPLSEWQDTHATLHMWTQMVGKTQLALAPRQNHWWHVTQYVSARGLITPPMASGSQTFDVEFDFVDHLLVLRTSGGARQQIPLAPRSVAEFYRIYVETLAKLGIQVHIWPVPCELEHPIRFTEDHTHASYDPVYANRFWRILAQVDQLLKRFRGRFLGKSSPVHFFWGSFDLATTRFSGKRAPARPGADAMTREAYSHEVISAGFWPGSGTVQEAAFYAYAAPEPPGFQGAALQPTGTRWDPQFKIFILPYDTVRTAPSPAQSLLAFLQSTYDAGADLLGWDRAALDRPRSEWDAGAQGSPSPPDTVKEQRP